MKNFVVNHNNYRRLRLGNPSAEPKTDLPSLTVPDQALSLKTLLERYTMGMEVPVRQAIYTDSGIIPDDLERMDEMERIQLARDLKVAVEGERQKIQRRREQPVIKPADVVQPSPPPELPIPE